MKWQDDLDETFKVYYLARWVWKVRDEKSPKGVFGLIGLRIELAWVCLNSWTGLSKTILNQKPLKTERIKGTGKEKA